MSAKKCLHCGGNHLTLDCPDEPELNGDLYADAWAEQYETYGGEDR